MLNEGNHTHGHILYDSTYMKCLGRQSIETDKGLPGAEGEGEMVRDANR